MTLFDDAQELLNDLHALRARVGPELFQDPELRAEVEAHLSMAAFAVSGAAIALHTNLTAKDRAEADEANHR